MQGCDNLLKRQGGKDCKGGDGKGKENFVLQGAKGRVHYSVGF